MTPGRGKVWFLGGGPGASDLLTVRAARALGEADVVVWGASLFADTIVSDYARQGAELVPWPPATMADIHAVYDRAGTERLVVARLLWGDPAMFGAIREEAQRARARDLDVEVVPGVTSLFAAAAALELELTTAPRASAPLILTAPREAPESREELRALARHGATMALFMVAKRAEELQSDLIEGGYCAATPCAVAHRVTWDDEQVMTCRLDELAATIVGRDIQSRTLVIVGPAVSGHSEAPPAS